MKNQQNSSDGTSKCIFSIWHSPINLTCLTPKPSLYRWEAPSWFWNEAEVREGFTSRTTKGVLPCRRKYIRSALREKGGTKACPWSTRAMRLPSTTLGSCWLLELSSLRSSLLSKWSFTKMESLSGLLSTAPLLLPASTYSAPYSPLAFTFPLDFEGIFWGGKTISLSWLCAASSFYPRTRWKDHASPSSTTKYEHRQRRQNRDQKSGRIAHRRSI